MTQRTDSLLGRMTSLKLSQSILQPSASYRLPPQLRDCYVCMEETNTIALPSCDKHHICLGCLSSAFQLAFKHQIHYPPRCCSDDHCLEISHYAAYFKKSFIDAYEWRMVEYNTPPALRLYCGRPGCNSFMKRIDRWGSIAPCSKCSGLTCMSCRHFVKDKFHECAQADDGDEMKNLALQNDWRNCPNCSVVIELGEACNHMRCGWCGCDFCFICLKTVEQRCRCPTYGKAEVDEDGFEVITGLHPATRLDREGYDRQGFNRRGINRAGKHFSETMVLSELGEMESEDERRKVRKTVGYRREEEEARRWLEAAVAGWQPDIARAWVEEGLARWREG